MQGKKQAGCKARISLAGGRSFSEVWSKCPDCALMGAGERPKNPEPRLIPRHFHPGKSLLRKDDEQMTAIWEMHKALGSISAQRQRTIGVF